MKEVVQKSCGVKFCGIFVSSATVVSDTACMAELCGIRLVLHSPTRTLIVRPKFSIHFMEGFMPSFARSAKLDEGKLK